MSQKYFKYNQILVKFYSPMFFLYTYYINFKKVLHITRHVYMLYILPMILFICMNICVCMCAKNIGFKLDYNFKDPFE